MIVLTWKKTDNFLTAFGKQILCACHVRNELNKERKPNEVIYTMPDHKPYYPRQFPNGTWTISEIVPSQDRLTTPFVIRTDAQQLVDTWETSNGMYTKKTGLQVMDKFYQLHMLNANETWGCIGIRKYDQFLWLLDAIKRNRSDRYLLQIQVTED